MVTQSFTDFTNQATSEAQIQELVNIARQGGREGAAAFEALRTIPGGLERAYGSQASVVPSQPPVSPAAPPQQQPTPSWFDKNIGRYVGATARGAITPLLPESVVTDLPAWTDAPILSGALPFDITTRELAEYGRQLTSPADLALSVAIASGIGAPAGIAGKAALAGAKFIPGATRVGTAALPAVRGAARIPGVAQTGRIARGAARPILPTGGGYPGFARRFAAENVIGLGAITGAGEVAQGIQTKEVPTWARVALPLGGALLGGAVGVGGVLGTRRALGRGGRPRVPATAQQAAEEAATTRPVAAEEAVETPVEPRRTEAEFAEPIYSPEEAARIAREEATPPSRTIEEWADELCAKKMYLV